MLRVEAGELANRVEDPLLDLCGDCVERFVDFLRSGARRDAMTLQTK
jgi:hypothetical protein